MALAHQESAVPAEIDVLGGGGTPMSQPSFDLRPINVVSGEQADDRESSGISSLDCSWSVIGTEMPWKPMPADLSLEGA